MRLVTFPWSVMKTAPRNRDRRNCMLEDQLLQISGFQDKRKFIETANLARELDAAHQVDCHIDTVSSKVIQKTVLYVLRILSICIHCPEAPLSLSLLFTLLFD